MTRELPGNGDSIPLLFPGSALKFQVIECAKRKPASTSRFLTRDERRSIVSLVIDHARYAPHVAKDFRISTREVLNVISEYYEGEKNKARFEGYLAGLANRKPTPPDPGVMKRAA